MDTKTKEENPILTGNIQRQIVTLAAPLLAGNILQQCYNIVDALIIGHFLGLEAFAAIGVAGTIMNLMIFVLSGFCTGVSVLFSTFYGMGNERKFRQEVFVALTFGSLVAVGITVLFLLGMKPILYLIRTPESLRGFVREYLTIIALGMIATSMYHLSSGILRSVGNTVASLEFLLLAVLANGVLDYLFVGAWGMGIAGSAHATVLSQLLAAFGCFGYLHRHNRGLLCRREDMRLHRELLCSTLHFGFASALQESNLYLGKMLVQGAVNGLGMTGIAAYTAAARLESFANSFGDSGALAMSVLISQNHGAGKEARVWEALKKGLSLHIIVGIVIPASLFVTEVPGLQLFLNGQNTEVLRQGVGYLRVVSVFYVLCFAGSAMVGFFRGVGKVHVPVIGTTLNIFTRVVLAFGMTKWLGLTGLGFATGIGWMVVVGYQLFELRKLVVKSIEK